MSPFEEQLKVIAQCRAKVAALKCAIAVAEDEFKASIAQELDDLDTWKTRLTDAEQTLKTAGEQYFVHTGDKHPVPGLDIIEKRKAVYDLVEALTWAREKATYMLVLDAKEFERTLLAQKAKTPDSPPGEIEVYPKATLSSDLSAYLDSSDE